MKKKINKVSNFIKQSTGVDVFENRRTRKHTEARSLLNYILRNNYSMTLYEIRDYYISNGKSYDHATALFSIKNFQTYKRFSDDIKKWYTQFENNFSDKELNKLKREKIKENIDLINQRYINKIYRITNNLINANK